MTGAEPPTRRRAVVNLAAQPQWLRTGYRYFPYAARQPDGWWVLRLNYDFPAHDLYTLFVDGVFAGDVTGSADSQTPLIAGVGALQPFDDTAAEPILEPDTATVVVSAVAQYVDYGSERDDRCIFCSGVSDGMERS